MIHACRIEISVVTRKHLSQCTDDLPIPRAKLGTLVSVSGEGAFSLSALDCALSSVTSPPPLTGAARASPTKSRSPAAFLGENSNLVNLDNLVATKGATPYGMGGYSTALATLVTALATLVTLF